MSDKTKEDESQSNLPLIRRGPDDPNPQVVQPRPLRTERIVCCCSFCDADPSCTEASCCCVFRVTKEFEYGVDPYIDANTGVLDFTGVLNPAAADHSGKIWLRSVGGTGGTGGILRAPLCTRLDLVESAEVDLDNTQLTLQIRGEDTVRVWDKLRNPIAVWRAIVKARSQWIEKSGAAVMDLHKIKTNTRATAQLLKCEWEEEDRANDEKKPSVSTNDGGAAAGKGSGTSGGASASAKDRNTAPVQLEAVAAAATATAPPETAVMTR